jgi:hypothetical protein
MDDKKLPKEIRKKVRGFMEALYRKKTGYNEREVR